MLEGSAVDSSSAFTSLQMRSYLANRVVREVQCGKGVIEFQRPRQRNGIL